MYDFSIRWINHLNTTHTQRNKFIISIASLCIFVQGGGGGALGCLIHLSPKFYNNIFLFVGSITLGTLVNFDWLAHSNVQPLILIYRISNFVFIFIWDVHQFNGHCLIPLDPWKLTTFCCTMNVGKNYPCYLYKLWLKINSFCFVFRFSGGRCYVVEGKMLKPATIDKVVME